MKLQTIKDWKIFYKNERLKLLPRIIKEIKSETKIKKDIDMLIKERGIISFPHTFLKDNYWIYLNIIKSLYKNKIKNVILIGVLHTREKSEEKYEFSLDNFKFLLNLYAKENHLYPIKIKGEFFPMPPPKKEDYNKISEYLIKLDVFSKKIKKLMDGQTIVLATGDLSHYGYGYGDKEIKKDYYKSLNFKIKHLLNLCYKKKDYENFVKTAPDIKFDQTSVSIIISKIFGNIFNIKTISEKFSDYSRLLNAKKPTGVMSIVYGVLK